ncbi:hypothetical protein [Viridibacillus arvi]
MGKSRKPDDRCLPHNRQPNFLFIIVDEERFPTVYENGELKEWRKNNLKA